MDLRGSFVTVSILVVFLTLFVSGHETLDETKDNFTDGSNFGRQLIEQGRTFIRSTMKRFAVLVPIIFFKLGIGFSLLVLVTLLAANNGLIGFLLLVVGVSAVLARFQTARIVPPLAPAVYAAPAPIPAHVHWDRKDSVETPQLHTSGPMLPNTYGSTDVVYQKYYPST